ncbi:hypothetical protein J6590_076793 [Homalodisca vitripennis]|nr:hypothetical protein J6590_076793 [Homalodisca vitripennis]
MNDKDPPSPIELDCSLKSLLEQQVSLFPLLVEISTWLTEMKSAAPLNRQIVRFANFTSGVTDSIEADANEIYTRSISITSAGTSFKRVDLANSATATAGSYPCPAQIVLMSTAIPTGHGLMGKMFKAGESRSGPYSAFGGPREEDIRPDPLMSLQIDFW